MDDRISKKSEWKKFRYAKLLPLINMRQASNKRSENKKTGTENCSHVPNLSQNFGRTS